MRKLYSIMGNAQRLDGGGMFGNVPKALWSRWLPADNNNQIPLASRCLLVQEENRNILFEVGVGAYMDELMRKRYGVQSPEHELLAALAELGLSHEDIDVVVLSHLHFDHAGGLLTAWQPNKMPALLFPHATFMVSEAAWERACNPHHRDKASYISYLPELLKNSDRLQLICDDQQPCALGEGYRFIFSEGHTPGLLLTVIDLPDYPLVFASDLIPGVPWVHLPVTMGYDRFAEKVIDEKEELLTWITKNNGCVFYYHDPKCALSKIAFDKNQRFEAEETQDFLDGFTGVDE